MSRVVSEGSTSVGIGTLVRAALPAVPVVNLLPGIRKSGQGPGRPRRPGLREPTVTIGRQHVAAYARVCGFPAKDAVPLTYPHILGFPMHLQAMADPGVPLPGHRRRPPDQHDHHPPRSSYRRDDRGHRRARRTSRPHAKGRTVDFVTEVSGGGETVWVRPVDLPAPGPLVTRRRRAPSGAGLRRGRRPSPSPGGCRATSAAGTPPCPATATRSTSTRSPPRHWASSGRSPTACGPPRVAWPRWRTGCPTRSRWRSAFRKPIFLPGAVAFGTEVDGQTDTGFAFSLSDPKSGAPHLQGRATRA